jgi:hypothetical protein
MNRRELLKPLGIVLVAWPITGQAQQVGKIYRIGFLANDPTIPMQAAGEAFLAGLRERGPEPARMTAPLHLCRKTIAPGSGR